MQLQIVFEFKIKKLKIIKYDRMINDACTHNFMNRVMNIDKQKLCPIHYILKILKFSAVGKSEECLHPDCRMKIKLN